jgi:hypothetical protein
MRSENIYPRERNVFIVHDNTDSWKMHSEGVVDSGANVNVIPKHVAITLDIEIFEEKNPYYIKFGQGETILITECILGSGLVEKLAISEGVGAILFNIIQFTSQGMLVIFDKTKVVVQYGGITIIEGRMLLDSNLYVFDLKELLAAPKVDMLASQGTTGGIAGQEVRESELENICFSSISKRYNKEDIRQARRIHVHLDHMPYSQIASNIRNGIWRNVPSNVTAPLVEAVGAKDVDCVSCAVTKWNREKVAVGTGVPNMVIGNSLSFDWIACKPESYWGSIGYHLFQCLATGYVTVLGGSDKSDSLIVAMKTVTGFYKQYGWIVVSVRCDAGSVEMSKKFGEVCAELHISPLPAAPEEQRSNPVERVSQDMKKGIHAALLSQMQLSSRHWLGAAQFAAVMRNIGTNTKSRQIDPEKSVLQLVTRVQPDLNHFGRLQFGQMVVVPTSQYESKKLSYLVYKNQLAVFLAPKLDGSAASYVMLEGGINPAIRKQLTIIRTKEHTITTELANKLLPTEEADGTTQFHSAVPVDFSLSSNIIEESNNNYPVSEQVVDITDLDRTAVPEIGWGGKENRATKNQVTKARTRNDSRIIVSDKTADEIVTSDEKSLTPIDTQVPTTTATDDKDKYEITTWNDIINRYGEDDTNVEDAQVNTSEAKSVFTATEQQSNFQATVLKVLKKRDDSNPSWGQLKKSERLQKMWGPSNREEFDGLAAQSFDRVEKEEAVTAENYLPLHVDMKTKDNGVMKTRAVWRGDIELRKGLHPDRDKLYSPNLKPSTFIMLISLGVYLKLNISSSDIIKAFSYNPYTREKPLYTSFDEVMSASGEVEYYRAKSIGYGLPEASRVFYDGYHDLMIYTGSTRSFFDICLYFKRRGNGILITGLTTDDALYLNSDNDEGRALLQEVHQAIIDKGWKMTVEPKVKELLGIHFQKNVNGSVTLLQLGQLKRVKEHFFPNTEYSDIPQVYVPLPREWTPEASKNSPPVTVNDFLADVGTIMYILRTRLDIGTSISILSGKGKSPTELDDKAANHLAAYLLTTATVGLTFYPGSEGADSIVRYIGAADAGFDVDLDSKSRFGWTAKQLDSTGEKGKGGAILAKSKKESGPPSDSACTAEVGAVCELIKDVVVIRGIADELGFPQDQPTNIEEDNQSVCQLTKDINGKGKRCRHIARHIAFVAGYIQEEIVKLQQVKTQEQEANILTKILSSPYEHWREAERLLGQSEEISTIRGIVSGRRKNSPKDSMVFSSVIINQTANQDDRREEVLSAFITKITDHSDDNLDYMRTLATVMNTYHNDASDVNIWRDNALSKNAFNKRERDVLLPERNTGLLEENVESQFEKKSRRGLHSKVNKHKRRMSNKHKKN